MTPTRPPAATVAIAGTETQVTPKAPSGYQDRTVGTHCLSLCVRVVH
jgi:hypothetical protein